MNKYELRGIKSVYAFQVLHTLLLGYWTIPNFENKKESFEAFLKRFETGTEEEKRAILTRAIYLVKLDKDEILSVCCFGKDKNGITYSAENIENLSYMEICNLIIDVCLEISKIKVFF